VEGADTSSLVKFSLSSHVCEAEGPLAGHLISHLHLTPDTPPARSPTGTGFPNVFF